VHVCVEGWQHNSFLRAALSVLLSILFFFFLVAGVYFSSPCRDYIEMRTSDAVAAAAAGDLKFKTVFFIYIYK
jgi:hypothetical protein